MALGVKLSADEVIERVKNLHHDTEVRLRMDQCLGLISDDDGARGRVRTYIVCSVRRVWKELGDQRELIITENEIYVEEKMQDAL